MAVSLMIRPRTITGSTLAKQLLRLSVLAGAMLLSTICVAQEPLHGHGALQVFDELGWQNTPRWVQVWIAIMGASFVSSVFFIRHHPPARWVLGCFLTGLMASWSVTTLFGWQPLSGLIAALHLIFWTPALLRLMQERAIRDAVTAYSIWATWMTAVILFSFVFDLRDAWIYLNHQLLG